MEQPVVNRPSLAGSVQFGLGRLSPGSPSVTITFGQIFKNLFNAAGPDSSQAIKVDNSRNETRSLAAEKSVSSSEPVATGPAGRDVKAGQAPVHAGRETTDATSRIDRTENGISQNAQPADETQSALPSQSGKPAEPQQKADMNAPANEESSVEDELVIIADPQLAIQMAVVAPAPEVVDAATPVTGTEGENWCPDQLSVPATPVTGTEGENWYPDQLSAPAMPDGDTLETAAASMSNTARTASEAADTSRGLSSLATDVVSAAVEAGPAEPVSSDVARVRFTESRSQQLQSAKETPLGVLDQQLATEAAADMKVTNAAAPQPDNGVAAFVVAEKPAQAEQAALSGSAGRDKAGGVLGISGPSGAAKMAQTEGRIVVSEVPPGASQAEMIDKIANAMKAAVRNGQQRLRMNLHPPNLGSLRIDLVLKEGVLFVSMRTDTSAARTLILSNSEHLKESLERQDVHVGNFNVTTSGDDNHGFFRPFELHDRTGVSGAVRRDDGKAAEVTAVSMGTARRPSLRRQLVDLVA